MATKNQLQCGFVILHKNDSIKKIFLVINSITLFVETCYYITIPQPTNNTKQIIFFIFSSFLYRGWQNGNCQPVYFLLAKLSLTTVNNEFIISLKEDIEKGYEEKSKLYTAFRETAPWLGVLSGMHN